MFYGKYRALVSNINDPEKRGRIKVKCPKVYGDFESPWCLPCVPFSADSGGMCFVPSPNDMVWVEFEEGDQDYPVWVGGLWTPNTAPTKYPTPNNYLAIKSPKGSAIEFDETTSDMTISCKGTLTLRANQVNIVKG